MASCLHTRDPHLRNVIWHWVCLFQRPAVLTEGWHYRTIVTCLPTLAFAFSRNFSKSCSSCQHFSFWILLSFTLWFGWRRYTRWRYHRGNGYGWRHHMHLRANASRFGKDSARYRRASTGWTWNRASTAFLHSEKFNHLQWPGYQGWSISTVP